MESYGGAIWTDPGLDKEELAGEAKLIDAEKQAAAEATQQIPRRVDAVQIRPRKIRQAGGGFRKSLHKG